MWLLCFVFHFLGTMLHDMGPELFQAHLCMLESQITRCRGLSVFSYPTFVQYLNRC